MTVQFPSTPIDCRQIEAILPPFVDGEAGAADAAVIHAHLARCAACRKVVEEQKGVRALLSSRRASLREAAPAGLESAVRQLTAAPSPVTATGAWSRRFSPLAAAAAVVLALFGGLYWGTGQSSVLLAAQLTLDHIKCFMIDGDAHAHAMTSDVAQVRLHESHGMDVKLPTPPSADAASLVSIRSCLYGEGWVAHVLYRVEGQPVSMFVMPGQQSAPADVSAFGRHTQVLTRQGVTYVLVAPARLTGVAAALGLEGE
jgi:anti-sigma factor RsiW